MLTHYVYTHINIYISINIQYICIYKQLAVDCETVSLQDVATQERGGDGGVVAGHLVRHRQRSFSRR